MSLLAIFGAVVAFIKAIPPLKDLLDRFIAWYIATEIASIERAQLDGIKKAVFEHDQIDLEKAINNPEAGKPSGIPGTSIRDSIPGVHNKK